MIVLGIETSCDETAVALYDSERGLLAEQVFSQTSHQLYGGVVPELASRDHIRKLVPMIEALLTKVSLSTLDLQGIACTTGPGLMGALLVGATVGQSLAFALNIPFIGVHHLEGHLLAPMLEENRPQFPFLALLVSGGHTQLIQVSAFGKYHLVGESVDDAAGEAFDKTAKLLGLPYPGGPHLAKLAVSGKRDAYPFPRPLLNKGLNLSFSGLKTAVATAILKADKSEYANIAASFEQAVIDTLLSKSLAALEHTQLNQLVVAGGVGANLQLREQLQLCADTKGFKVFYPRISLCTDNAAMIAYAGTHRLLLGEKTDILKVRARWPLEELTKSL